MVGDKNKTLAIMARKIYNERLKQTLEVEKWAWNS